MNENHNIIRVADNWKKKKKTPDTWILRTLLKNIGLNANLKIFRPKS